MTVHMLRIVTSIEGTYTLAQLNAAMDDWVSNQSEWTDDRAGHNIVEHYGENGSAPGHRTGRYRFRIVDAKDNLIQKCEDKLVNKVAWYRIGYHECDHDRDDRQGCSWGEQREWTAKDVTIPDGTPVFVEAPP